MAVLGMRRTIDMVADERPKEWRIGINELNPNAAPLVHLIERVGKERGSDPEFSWWERSYPNRVLTVDSADVPGSVSAGSTDTCAVSSGDAYNVVKGMVLQNVRTEEVVWVTTDPTSSSAIAIYRGVGATGTVAAWQAGDSLVVIGTAAAEGASVPTAISYDVTKLRNYCQTFRRATDNTRIALRTKLRTGDLRRRAQEEAFMLFNTERERAYLFGKPDEITVGNDIVRFTGGLTHFISSHILDASSGLSLSAFRGFMYDIFEDGSDEKILYATTELMEVLETMFDYNSIHMREVPGTDTFGMTMTRVMMGGGTLFIQHHKDMTKIGKYQGWGIVVDPDKLTQRYVDDVKWLPNRQNPGDDRNIGEYLGDFGLEVHNEECFGIIKDATTYLP